MGSGHGRGNALILVGGAGRTGTALAARCRAQGRPYHIVDRRPPPTAEPYIHIDLVTDPPALPPGPVVLLAGNSDPHCPHPWLLALDNAVTAIRLLPALAGRTVTLISSAEVYGTAPGPHTPQTPPELPLDDAELTAWCTKVAAAACEPCPPWRMAGLCRDLAGCDPTGRWVYALAKRAQELALATAIPPDGLTVLRVADLIPDASSSGHEGVVGRLARRAMAGLPLRVTDAVRAFLPVGDLAGAILRGVPPGIVNAGVATLPLPVVAELVRDELGAAVQVEVQPVPAGERGGQLDVGAFAALCRGEGSDDLRAAVRAFARALRDLPAVGGPPLPVVIPPRPHRPDVVAERIQQSLWSGAVKAGGPWTAALAGVLRDRLGLGDEHELLVTSSGTAALRLAVLATAGPARPGDVAVLPSFTFLATGEALAQLGYRLRLCDVRPADWTLDPAGLDAALARGGVRVVVAVDALGAPADYPALDAVCRRYGVPLVADSAPALGARLRGRPVGTQADAHAFSMSFAKVVSAAGAGGALVVPRDRAHRLRRPVDWTRSALLGEVPAVAALDLAERLDELLERRERVAAAYRELADARADVVPQRVAEGDRHALVHWVARFTGGCRDRVAAGLAARGIATKPYYSPVLHDHDWAGLAEPARPLPVTEDLAREALALPTSSEMTAADAERVVCAVLSVMRSQGGRR